MKKSYLKKCYMVISSAVIFILQLPFVFAKAIPFSEVKWKPRPLRLERAIEADSTFGNMKTVIGNSIGALYNSLRLNLMGLSEQAFEYAMMGFDLLVKAGKVTNDKIISIIDFSQPSSKKRLFVIDLASNQVVFNTYVAHGMNSGTDYARCFSNTPGSEQSSPGFYETLNTYIGHNGYSLQLQGLECGINDNANRRAIVVHGAPYVSEGFIQTRGYIGRSLGCPAVPVNLNRPIIDRIKDGTCLFIYSPDKNYLNRSGLLYPAGI